MFGQKRIPSREGGVEIVVEELGKRMVKKGHQVTCYNRKGKHVSDADLAQYAGKHTRESTSSPFSQLRAKVWQQ